MDLSKIKLVVSDMDGTLLNSNHEVSDTFFELFEQLEKHDITFVAASGRQYHSMVHKLAPIKDKIYIIAENGGITKFQNKTLDTNYFDSNYLEKVLETVTKIDDTMYVLCSENHAFVKSDDDDSLNIFKQYFREYKVFKHIDELKNIPIIKIAVHHKESSEKFIYPYLSNLSSNKDLLVKISSPFWIDISNNQCNKGNALKKLQKQLNITPEECVAFGDYHNDIEMLQSVTHSFAMKNAHNDIQQIARYTTKSNNDNGVEYILNKIIQSKELNNS